MCRIATMSPSEIVKPTLKKYKVLINFRIFMSIAIQEYEVEATDEQSAGKLALAKSDGIDPWVDSVEEVKYDN